MTTITESTIDNFQDYVNLSVGVDLLTDGTFAVVGLKMFELVLMEFEDRYQAAVSIFEAPEFYGPDHDFQYSADNFVSARVFTYTGNDNAIEIEMEEQAKEFFKELIAEHLF